MHPWACAHHTRVLTASSLSQCCWGWIGAGQTETESAVRRDQNPVLISRVIQHSLLSQPFLSHAFLPPDTTPKLGAAVKYGSQIAWDFRARNQTKLSKNSNDLPSFQETRPGACFVRRLLSLTYSALSLSASVHAGHQQDTPIRLGNPPVKYTCKHS